MVDDHPHVTIALRALLEKSPDIQLVAESRRGSEAAAIVAQYQPDILFMDLIMEPSFNAVQVIQGLRAEHPALKICLFSAYLEPSYVRDFLKAGAHGYILKDDDYVTEFERIIRDLMDGDIYLSPQAYRALAVATRQAGDERPLTDREREILTLVARGLPNPQVAQSLHLSAGTVRNHLSAIYKKMGVSTRHQAVETAQEKGWI